MRFVMCVMRDVRANVFGNPFFVQSVGQAERQFGDEVNRPVEENVIYKHPEDFELYHLGFFDCVTGKFEILKEPTQLAVGSGLVRAVPGDKRQLPLGVV